VSDNTSVTARAAFAFLLAILTCSSLSAQKRSGPLAKPTAKSVPAPKPYQWTKPANPVVSKWLQSLTLRRKIAQLIIVPISGDSLVPTTQEYKDLDALVHTTGVGGLIVINRSERGVLRRAAPYEMVTFLNYMQRRAGLPLIVAGDFERGAAFRVGNVTEFPDAMAFAAAGDVEATRAFGAATARQSRALGTHWVYAPDADVNNNPDNPIINTRSFGEDPDAVVSHVKAFIEGARSDPKYRVLVTVKHFPGHGDTAVDSHSKMPVVAANRQRLESMEFRPFRAAVDLGVDAVMSAHISVPALEASGAPSTVSPAILTGILRNEWKFPGIIVTDAMNMGGLATAYAPGQAAVAALEAGVDVLLIPGDPKASVDAVAAAVRAKKISVRRLNESVLRVLNAKYYAGLARSRATNPDQISVAIHSAEDQALANRVAESAVTLVKDSSAMLPLADPSNACYVVLSERRYSLQGQVFLDELRRRAPAARTRLVTPEMESSELSEAAKNLASCPSIVVAAFASFSSAGPGRPPLRGPLPGFLQQLANGRAPLALVSLGSPYLLRYYPNVPALMTTFSPAPSSELAAVRALFGEIPIRGKSPVTIPGVSRLGDGIERQATRTPR
jgi:beta-N-acetylhexosaminidase